MKKIYSFVIVLAAAAMVSCCGNSQKPCAGNEACETKTECAACPEKAEGCCEEKKAEGDCCEQKAEGECQKAAECEKACEKAAGECEKACEKACENK